jgi:hypothetical protein
MTLDRARELIGTQRPFGCSYDRNALRLLLGEVQREHGREAAEGLIREFDPEQAFDLKPGADFSGVGR